MKIISITSTVRRVVLCMASMGSSHKQRNPILIYVCCMRHDFKCLNTDFAGSINKRNICLIVSPIYSFIPVSVCIDRDLNALLWQVPIMLIRRTWPYAIHHVHFMNMHRLYIAYHMSILLIHVGCVSWYFRNLIIFHGLKDHTFILHTPRLLPTV